MTDRETEIDIVKHLSGVSDESRITVNESGWTSRVYLVDGGQVVFKFPRTKDYRDECKKEVATLELLKRHSFTLSTPALQWTTEDNVYFGFYGVLGRPLKEVVATLNDKEKMAIGTQLGDFLRQLHSLQDYGEVNAQTLEEQVIEYTEMYQNDRALFEAFFTDAELAVVDVFFQNEVKAAMRGSGELVFCHGDLDYNNVLIDDKHQVGVIDFGDAGLYDRSQDFRGMEDHTLRSAMMEAYGGGELFSIEAAEATAKMIDILNLPYIIKNRDTIERDECIRRIRRGFMMQ